MTGPSTASGDSGTVKVEGAELGYRIEGHGPTCLVVGSSIYYPRAFSQGLRNHLRLVFVDLRHFAPSDPSFDLDQISLETYANDIERMREALGLGDVIVIGHSNWAGYALDYAQWYPEHVRGAVWLGGAPVIDEAEVNRLWETDASQERKELYARKQAELTPELRATLSPSELFIRESAANGPLKWYDANYDNSPMFDEVFLNLPVFDRFAELEDDDFDWADVAARLDAPVLVVVGRYDYRNPYTLWERDRDSTPYTFVLLDRSGHIPMFEEPELFDQTLLDWVGSLPSSTG